MRKSILVVSFLGSLIGSGLSVAQSYQSEFGVGLGRVNWETTHSDSYGVRGTYYFGSVNTERGPLDEAEFLSRSTSLHGEVNRTNTDTSYGTVQKNDYELSFRYESTRSPWVATINLNRYELELPNYDVSGGGHGSVSGTSSTSSPFKSALNTFELGVGCFVTDATLVHVSYERYTTEHVTYVVDRAVTVDAKHLFTLSNDRALSLTAALNRTEGDKFDLYGTTALIGANYYFSRASSVGVGYSEFFYEGSGPDVTDREWSVLFSRFFTERYRLGAEYSRDDFAASISRSFALTFDARF